MNFIKKQSLLFSISDEALRCFLLLDVYFTTFIKVGRLICVMELGFRLFC